MPCYPLLFGVAPDLTFSFRNNKCERSLPGLNQLNYWCNRWELHFGIGIIQGTIPSGFPVFDVIVPGCSRNGYGASPHLRVQKKFVKFRQSTQNTWLRLDKFLGQFIRDLLSIYPETWVMNCSVIPGVNVFSDWPLLVLYCVSLETAASFRLFLSVAIILREEKAEQLWRLN